MFQAHVLTLMARHMASPFLPLLVQDLYRGERLATTVGAIVGGAALAGALVSPGAGALGDRLGYGRVLRWAAAAAAMGAVGSAIAPSLGLLALASLLFSGALSAVAAMCVALLATTTPEERRSPTLNLALVPLYVGGIVGPALGAALATLGLRATFLGGAGPLAVGLALSRGLPGRARGGG